MIGNVTIRRETGDLVARMWTFSLHDARLRCVRYVELTRASKRRTKAATSALWSWYDSEMREHGSPVKNGIAADVVPWDDTVAAEALAALVAQIKVVGPEAK